VEKSALFSRWDLLWRKEDLRFQVKILRAQRWAEPPGAIVLLWLISALTCICAQSSRDVHRAPASDGIPGGPPNRLHKRSIARSDDYVTAYTQLI
jgi:hypothetical protein